MKCPKCEAWTEVMYTRPMDGYRRRRYLCANMHKFWTEERVVSGPSSIPTDKMEALLTIEAQRRRLMNPHKK